MKGQNLYPDFPLSQWYLDYNSFKLWSHSNNINCKSDIICMRSSSGMWIGFCYHKFYRIQSKFSTVGNHNEEATPQTLGLQHPNWISTSGSESEDLCMWYVTSNKPRVNASQLPSVLAAIQPSTANQPLLPTLSSMVYLTRKFKFDVNTLKTLSNQLQKKNHVF